jgi:hypothetical protein
MQDTAAMEAAFALVSDQDDWKGRIQATVEAKDLPSVIQAIAFYTGTPTTVVPNEFGGFRVESVGYRAGPAGP